MAVVSESVRRLRVLVIGEAANPEWMSGPLVTWSHFRALQSYVDAHLVTQIRNAPAIERAGLPADAFTAIDSEKFAGPIWKVASALRGGEGKGWTTLKAFGALSYPYFERLLWQRFGEAIRAGEWDVVHRVSPISPTWPSPIAKRLKAAGVPFVVGPINGGLPWPEGFGDAQRKEREWLASVRGAYRWLPGYRATRDHADALVPGSRATWDDMDARWHAKCVYVPENGIDLERFPAPEKPRTEGPLRAAFVGRFVPYKGADMLIEAAAPLVKQGRLVLDLIGDGPERSALEAQVRSLGCEGGVTFAGWVPQERLAERLQQADLLTFPSVREFGGAVVMEAMALGVVPMVVDYGGPAEILDEGTGFAIPLGSRDEIVAGFAATLAALVDEPARLAPMRGAARERVLAHFTWDAKARQSLEIYDWVLGRGEKPDFGMPLARAPRSVHR